MARAKSNFKNGWSSIDNTVYNNQMTTYNGQRVTIAQARGMKAAATRKANAEKRKARNEFMKSSVLQGVLSEIKKTMKSVRNLKTICAFHDNGPVQWYTPYRQMMEMFPEIDSVLVKYHSHYDEVVKTVERLNKLIKSSKTDKDFFGIAEKFGYQMWTLVDLVKEVSDTISKSGVLYARTFEGKEIIESSPDKRRPGLKHIMHNTYSTVSTTEKNIINLNISLKHAYDDLVEYDVNGKLIKLYYGKEKDKQVLKQHRDKQS